MVRAKGKARVVDRGRRVERVQEWRRSGLSQAAFCREHGLNANTFNNWTRCVLKERSGVKRHRRVGRATRTARGSALESGVKFTPVRVVARHAEAPAGLACGVFEVSLRGGHSIRIASDFDEASLRRLLGVLRDEGVNGAC